MTLSYIYIVAWLVKPRNEVAIELVASWDKAYLGGHLYNNDFFRLLF